MFRSCIFREYEILYYWGGIRVIEIYRPLRKDIMNGRSYECREPYTEKADLGRLSFRQRTRLNPGRASSRAGKPSAVCPGMKIQRSQIMERNVKYEDSKTIYFTSVYDNNCRIPLLLSCFGSPVSADRNGVGNGAEDGSGGVLCK